MTMRVLRDYQQRAVTELYEQPEKIAVLPMGAGKTAIALTAIGDLVRECEIRQALVLAPKRVAEITWPAELKEWPQVELLAGMDVVAGGPGTRSKILFEGPGRIKVMGIDNAQWLCGLLKDLEADDPLFDLLVIDEISRFKDPKGKRYKDLMKVMPRFKNVWGLTGTPRPNGDEDLFAPANIITRGKLWGRSFYKWRQERFYPTDRNGYNWAPLPGASERIAAEFATIAFRLDDGDMPELPPHHEVFDEVVLPPAVRRQYDTMQEKLFAELGSDDAVLAASAAIASGKLAQIAQGFLYIEDHYEPKNSGVALHRLKLDWLHELVDSLDGEPLVVFYDFQEDQARLRAEFPKMIFLGDLSGREAALAVDLWNQGGIPLLALHPASAGHGLNLQHGGSKMAWYSLPWSAELFDQATARLLRPGQAGERVTSFHCIASGTVDEMKRHRVISKMSAQDAFRRYLDAV
jgi:hypothetical protein